MPWWRNGIRARLKIAFRKGIVGSSPSHGTIDARSLATRRKRHFNAKGDEHRTHRPFESTLDFAELFLDGRKSGVLRGTEREPCEGGESHVDPVENLHIHWGGGCDDLCKPQRVALGFKTLQRNPIRTEAEEG